MSAYRIFDGYQMIFSDTLTEEFPCMKSTQLWDTKGREIYESDILFDGKNKGVVEYDEYDLRFYIRRGAELKGFYEVGNYVVLGNAFENPELI